MRLAVFVVWLFGVAAANGQGVAPTCAQGAICFSGKVSEGEEFRRPIHDRMEFVLRPAFDKKGWIIEISALGEAGGCKEFASVANPPYRAHRDLYIDTSYGWTAEEELSISPRQFRFVTNCKDYQTEAARLDVVLWPNGAESRIVDEAMAKLGTSPMGEGRMWITESHASHAGGDKQGKIEWMKFSVEIKLPGK